VGPHGHRSTQRNNLRRRYSARHHTRSTPLEHLHIHPESELAVVFVDNDAMSHLHQEWMGLDGPTDVMSFPMDELRPGTQQKPAEGLLGDIVISPEVATDHANIGGHSVADEIALLVTHGLLHLLGYDHHDETTQQQM